jgi:beta-galactosidase/beta-glucuronidase
MVYDLKVLKDLGFNMVRKHIKVETDLFYRACDELGLLVIQDMPNLRLSGDIPGVMREAPKLVKEANADRECYAPQGVELSD